MSTRPRRSIRISSFIGCLVAAVALLAGGAAASSYKTLYSFCSRPGCTDGATPIFGVIPDSKGRLYGITQIGGKSSGGTVYSLLPQGNGTYTFSLIYRFCSKANCSDGQTPTSPLFLDTNGNLYGATQAGGPSGNGVVYELIPNADRSKWTRLTLYAFCPSATAPCPDGSGPFGPLTYAGAQTGALYDGTSTLYGVTSAGGNGKGGADNGVLFSLRSANGKPRRKEKVLYNFCSQASCADGSSPFGLTIDAKGVLYGAAQDGGSASDDGGVVYQFDPKTVIQTVLYTFCSYFTTPNCADGDSPQTPLTWDAQGRLYGTTTLGGGGEGVVFEITPKGKGSTEQVLYSFCRFTNCTDGARPLGVTIDQSGNIWGTASVGNKYPGTNCLGTQLGCGVLFRLSGSSYKVLHQFCPTGPVGCADGAAPIASNLLIGSSGNMIGSAAYGGVHRGGTIFEYSP